MQPIKVLFVSNKLILNYQPIIILMFFKSNDQVLISDINQKLILKYYIKIICFTARRILLMDIINILRIQIY